jgi:methyl-accepting chemotaxis protein
VGQLSQTTQQNASSSEELAATAEEMSSQAEQLQQTMGFFTIDRQASPREAASQLISSVRQGAAGQRSGGRRASPAHGQRPGALERQVSSSHAPDESNFTRY